MEKTLSLVFDECCRRCKEDGACHIQDGAKETIFAMSDKIERLEERLEAAQQQGEAVCQIHDVVCEHGEYRLPLCHLPKGESCGFRSRPATKTCTGPDCEKYQGYNEPCKQGEAVEHFRKNHPTITEILEKIPQKYRVADFFDCIVWTQSELVNLYMEKLSRPATKTEEGEKPIDYGNPRLSDKGRA